MSDEATTLRPDLSHARLHFYFLVAADSLVLDCERGSPVRVDGYSSLTMSLEWSGLDRHHHEPEYCTPVVGPCSNGVNESGEIAGETTLSPKVFNEINFALLTGAIFCTFSRD